MWLLWMFCSRIVTVVDSIYRFGCGGRCGERCCGGCDDDRFGESGVRVEAIGMVVVVIDLALVDVVY